jgi:hypothetical protein
MDLDRCIGCGGLFPKMEGPTHRYMESSPGCWAIYGEVLAREYGNVAFSQTHRMTVDAYAAQHPGHSSPQSIQSVAGHLIRLCLLLEHGLEIERANAAMLKAIESKEKFAWLTPPPSRGALTVLYVHSASSVEDHVQRVRVWAASVWAAWAPHHDQIRQWLPVEFDSRKRRPEK